MMRTEEEIRKEIKELDERLKGMSYTEETWDRLNARKWALKWVLVEVE